MLRNSSESQDEDCLLLDEIKHKSTNMMTSAGKVTILSIMFHVSLLLFIVPCHVIHSSCVLYSLITGSRDFTRASGDGDGDYIDEIRTSAATDISHLADKSQGFYTLILFFMFYLYSTLFITVWCVCVYVYCTVYLYFAISSLTCFFIIIIYLTFSILISADKL